MSDSLIRWVPGRPGTIPPNAVVGGRERDGSPLFVARGVHMGGLHPGKTGNGREFLGANIGFQGREINLRTYEVLVGSAGDVKWIQVNGLFSLRQLQDYTPVRGGREADGTPLYIAQAAVGGGVHCGKVKENSFALIPFHHEEHIFQRYRVLVHDMF